MAVAIRKDMARLHVHGLLERLLVDGTTGSNILWATDAYAGLGPEYRRNRPIEIGQITGGNAGLIRNRAEKALDQQSVRTRQRGEVFTPMWVCGKMNNYVDEVWFGRPDVFHHDGMPTDRVEFPAKPGKHKTCPWMEYVDSRRLEITCGEAPYLVSRYDASTGEEVGLRDRIGILDRKLRVVNENAQSGSEWMKWAVRAFEATYGYEYQGDNLLIARINLLATFEDYLKARWGREPDMKEYAEIIRIITWNIWQMDGLTGMVPYGGAGDDYPQLTLFGDRVGTADADRPRCRIVDWRGRCITEYARAGREDRCGVKFDFAIGNPPYQDEALGGNKGYAPPVYHRFLDAAYQVADAVELIHPARFLFHAGSTPKAWNRQMLADPCLKVLHYEQDAGKIFSNTEIKGGVAITYHDSKKSFGPVGVFCPYAELNSIMRKAAPEEESGSLMSIIFIQNRFDLEALYAEHPEYRSVIGSDGRDKRFRNNIFDKVSLFTEGRTGADDVAVIGVVKNRRQWRYLPKRFIDAAHENLFKWKVLVVRVNGVGAAGEILSTPIVAKPREGYTQTFIGIGAFDTREEAENALKYVKTKFARIMLGILKITQDNNRDTWRMVPLQDFTPASDIDWSKSVSEIDRQLFAKYDLDEQEIEFIETHAREME